MPKLNIPANLFEMFRTLDQRLRKLETGRRFTAPVVPALTNPYPTITGLISGDPTNPRPGDVWLNSTSNTLRAVDKNGAVKTITWS
jgi:hypothetical protein